MKQESPVMADISYAINNIKGLRFQPITFLDNDKTVAWEVLSWLHNKNPEEWFSALSPPLYLAIFYWQVNEVNGRSGQYWLNLPVKVIHDPFSVSHIIGWEHNNQLTIEIQDPEALLTLNERELQQFKSGIARLKAAGWSVWLDDMKTAIVNAILPLRLKVDGIKIDRHEIHDPVKLNALISRSRLMSQNILVEGIETVPSKECAYQSGAALGQGFLWPETREETSSQHALSPRLSQWQYEKTSAARNAVTVFFACEDRYFIAEMEKHLTSIIENDYPHQRDMGCHIVDDISDADIAFMDNIPDSPLFGCQHDWRIQGSDALRTRQWPVIIVDNVNENTHCPCARVTTVLPSKEAMAETAKTLRVVISRIVYHKQHAVRPDLVCEKCDRWQLNSGKKTSLFLWSEPVTKKQGYPEVIS